MVSQKIAAAIIASLVYLSPISAADRLDASFSPPGGLAVDSVPLFIVLGFDDNRYPDGMKWVLDLLKNKKNHVGTRNPATFDDTDIKAVFYHTSGALDDGTHGGNKLLTLWKEAYSLGHEVGCHTVTHNTSKATTLDMWKKEIKDCNSRLVKEMAIDVTQIAGFRTPYLDFNAETFTAIAAEGLKYECTMTLMQDYNKSQFYWPFTLDAGFPKGVIAGWEGKVVIPGLWELPVYTINSDPTMWPPITGFDSSVLTQANGKDYESMLKQSLAYRLKVGGNRAPLTVGLHSDTYASANPAGVNYDKALTLEGRRAALKNFIEYALTFPQVRFVTGVQLISWMKNPVPLGRTATTGIIPVSSSMKSDMSMSVNGASVSFNTVSSGIFTAELFSLAGRKVWQNEITAKTGSTFFDLPLSFKGQGILTISGEGKSIHQKIIQ